MSPCSRNLPVASGARMTAGMARNPTQPEGFGDAGRWKLDFLQAGRTNQPVRFSAPDSSNLTWPTVVGLQFP